MENKIWNVKASIETTWVGSHKLVNLTKREQEELNRWLDENHRQFFLDDWDFNVGLSDTVINLLFFYLPDDDIMMIMDKIRDKIESIIAKRKEVK